MKACEKCGAEYSDELNDCPFCHDNVIISKQISHTNTAKPNFLRTKIFRTILLCAAGAVVISIMIFSGRYFLNKYKTRYLTQANAFLAIGDKKSAAPLLLKYLLNNSSDKNVKLIYASTLQDIGEKSKALEVYKAMWEADKLEINPKKKLSKIERDRIKINAYYINNDELWYEHSKAAEEAIAKKKFDEARLDYIKMATCLSDALDYMEPTEEDWSDNSEIITRGEHLIAEYVISYWLEGNHEKAYDLAGAWNIPEINFMSFKYDQIMAELSKRKNFGWIKIKKDLDLANFLDEQADKSFEQKKWDSSIEAYTAAAEYYKKIGMGSAVAECLYNSAMACWNKGSFQESKSLLNKIRTEYPKYEQTTVNSRMVEITGADAMNQAANIEKEAGEYFDKKDWVAARAYYITAINKLLGIGFPDTNDLVSECRYNICLTYYNEHDFNKCKEKLLELQAKNPAYQPALVKELLDKVEKLIG
jgi:hypothetical protein